jgi:hypothetical protein
MNTQQKIEKIREIVIMKNNPECKSYEEALQKEYGSNDCLLGKYESDVILSKSVFLALKCYKDDNIKFDVILGLPITLERLLIALNNIDDHSYYSFGTGDIYCSEEDWSCVWQPNKLLEEQSEETIDAIYNILF